MKESSRSALLVATTINDKKGNVAHNISTRRKKSIGSPKMRLKDVKEGKNPGGSKECCGSLSFILPINYVLKI